MALTCKGEQVAGVVPLVRLGGWRNAWVLPDGLHDPGSRQL
jgi:hypothetical protein